ncbi:MAG: Lipoprotein signal peptidase [Mycoplasmataceae bacterium]|nr:MAG: Lipoprotein signal peptidase [Mycoplasmataceae bacterium]
MSSRRGMGTIKKTSSNKIESREIKEKMNKKEIKRIDEKLFKRITDKFKEYWKILSLLIFAYIVLYLVWVFAAAEMLKHLNSSWTMTNGYLAIVVIITQGIFFCLDGWVTSLLKAPFNQMCYAINKAEGIDDKQKDYIITKLTESNEHCKETLKKFGIMAVSGELARVFIRAQSLADNDKLGKYAAFFHISYLIPLTFAALALISINRELNKIKKTLNSSDAKKS